MATYAIGDIQGCYHELISLLNHIRFDSNKDTLWLAGDLVNRGPQSLEVLRFIKRLGDKHIVVLGNHDFHFLAIALKCRELRPPDTFQEALKAPDLHELIDWLRTRKLFHWDAQLNFALVHAGIYPFWSLTEAQQYADEVEKILSGYQFQSLLQQIYGNKPDRWSADLADWDRYRFIINVFCRMRYCTPDGRLDMKEKGSLGSCPLGLHPWFSIKNEKIKHVNIAFGHWASLNGVSQSPHAFAIDTGCSWGHRLTALRLEDREVFSVPSTTHYPGE